MELEYSVSGRFDYPEIPIRAANGDYDPMRAEKIKSTLKRLHKVFAATESVDSELKTLLQELDADIQKLLRQDEPSSPDAAGVVDRIEYIATNFAVEHPQANAILRELADVLGKMGI